uniref:MTTase N-terminal domain-containing protein n=1 Tax=Zea mays TaxID=4577 RepID=A0A804PQB9_MAIZE
MLAEVRGGSNSGDNSGEQLLPIRASSAESEGTAAFVSSKASSQRVRFIDWIPESPAIDGFLLGSGEGLLPRLVSGSTTSTSTKGRIYHKMYGCQMNISDMEIVLSIMKNEAIRLERQVNGPPNN